MIYLYVSFKSSNSRFYTFPALLTTMLGDQVSQEASRVAQLIVAFSSGYFLHDSIDMIISKVYLNSVGVWIHHILVIGCFIGSIALDKYGVYLVFNLIGMISQQV